MEQEITFVQVNKIHLPIVRSWWREKPNLYVKEFWDHSPEMWANFENYANGKKDEFDYWIGFINRTPFALVMSNNTKEGGYEPGIQYAEKEGITIGLDFMIGEESFLGKGLGDRTLMQFMKYMRTLDSSINAFLIDPEMENTRAVHVYEKAGFKIVGCYQREGKNNNLVKYYMMKVFPEQLT